MAHYHGDDWDVTSLLDSSAIRDKDNNEYTADIMQKKVKAAAKIGAQPGNGCCDHCFWVNSWCPSLMHPLILYCSGFMGSTVPARRTIGTVTVTSAISTLISFI